MSANDTPQRLAETSPRPIPAHLAEAGEGMLRAACRDVVRAHRGFPRSVDLAKKYGMDETAVWRVCGEEGLDSADVRGLLEGK